MGTTVIMPAWLSSNGDGGRWSAGNDVSKSTPSVVATSRTGVGSPACTVSLWTTPKNSAAEVGGARTTEHTPVPGPGTLIQGEFDPASVHGPPCTLVRWLTHARFSEHLPGAQSVSLKHLFRASGDPAGSVVGSHCPNGAAPAASRSNDDGLGWKTASMSEPMAMLSPKVSRLLTTTSQSIMSPAVASWTGMHDEHSAAARQRVVSGGVHVLRPASGPPTQNAAAPTAQSPGPVHGLPSPHVSPGPVGVGRRRGQVAVVAQGTPELLHVPVQRLRLVHVFATPPP